MKRRYFIYVSILLLSVIGVWTVTAYAKKTATDNTNLKNSSNITSVKSSNLPEKLETREKVVGSETTTKENVTRGISAATKKEEPKSTNMPGGVNMEELYPNKQSLQRLPNDESEKNDVFIDKNEIKYYFDKKSGNYTGFYKTTVYSNENAKQKFSQNEMQKMADQLISNCVDLDVLKFAKYHFQEGTGIHTFLYERGIDGYATSERASISFTQEGLINSLGLYNIGSFNDITIPKIDEKELDNKFDTLVKEQYKDVIQGCEIQTRSLDVKDSNLIMKYSFILIRHGGIKSGEILEIPVS